MANPRPGDEARPVQPGEPRPDAARRARQQVAQENHAAALQTFDPSDARWMLARKAADSIEGGRAAVLPPEKRARLVGLATRLGLRPFDAHLVIAIVQDGARTGEGALGEQPRQRLAMIRPPAERLDGVVLAMRLLVAGLLATGIGGLMIAWLSMPAMMP